MLAKVFSSAVLGIDAYIVDVEGDGVGLPDVAVKESRDRVKAAIKNAGFEFPARRITVNLAPADIKKEGVAFDLPIAVGILAATEAVRPEALRRYAILGELSLDGGIRPIRGVLPMAVEVKAAGLEGLLMLEKRRCVGGKDASLQSARIFPPRHVASHQPPPQAAFSG